MTNIWYQFDTFTLQSVRVGHATSYPHHSACNLWPGFWVSIVQQDRMNHPFFLLWQTTSATLFASQLITESTRHKYFSVTKWLHIGIGYITAVITLSLGQNPLCDEVGRNPLRSVTAKGTGPQGQAAAWNRLRPRAAYMMAAQRRVNL